MGTEQTGPLHNNIWYCLIVLDGELCKITDSKKLILRGILTLVTLHSEAAVGTASLQEGIKVSSDSFARVSRRKKKQFFHVEPVSKLSCKVVFSFSISLHQVLLWV